MIVIVGAGALGSHVTQFLRNMKDKLRVVDFDRIEQKNILAQFHSKLGLRNNKAVALGRAMDGLFGVKIEMVPNKLSFDNVGPVLGEADLIIDCTDNFEARGLIQGYALDTDTPCLHGALSADGVFARIMWADDFEADEEGEDGEATCIDGEHLPFFAMVAAYLAVEAQRFCDTGKKQSFQLTPAGITRLR